MGTLHRNFTLAGFSLKILIGAMCLFLFSVDSWGACTEYVPGTDHTNNYAVNNCDAWSYPKTCIHWEYCKNNFGYNCRSNDKYVCGNPNQVPHYSGYVCLKSVRCDSRAEEINYRDSLNCVNSGESWVNGTCRKSIDTTAVCAEQKSICDEYGGKYTIVAVDENNCASECDVCGSEARIKVMNAVNTKCCSQGLAPPDSVQLCYNKASSGWGLNFSVFNNDDYRCQNTTTADGEPIGDNLERFKRFCEDMDSYKSPEDSISGGGSGGVPPDSMPSIIDTLANGQGDFEYNYYPILDTIRDSLVLSIVPNLDIIASCFRTGDCFKRAGDTVIINTPSDSLLLRAIRDSIVKKFGNIEDSLAMIGFIADTNKKYLTLVGGAIHEQTDSLQKYMGGIVGEVSKTSDSITYALRAGTDSILYGLDYVDDTVNYESGFSDMVLDSIFDTTGFGGGFDSLGKDFKIPDEDSLGLILSGSIQNDYDSLTDNLKNAFDTLRHEFMIYNFDSAFIAPLGMKVPNTNTCPEDCFNVDMSGIGGAFAGVKNLNYGLCKTYPILGGLNVLGFVRILIRLIVAVTCIYVCMWVFVGRKN